MSTSAKAVSKVSALPVSGRKLLLIRHLLLISALLDYAEQHPRKL